MSRTESYSSLATLASCCEKYRLSYVERLDVPGTDPAMHNGTCMHAAFRTLYDGGFRGTSGLPEAVEVLNETWGTFKPPLGHKKEHLTRTYAETRLRRYVEERESDPTILEEGEIVAAFTEEMHTFDWVDSEGRLVRVRGIPDIVFRHGRYTYVVDNKFPTSGWLNDFYFLRFKLGFQLRIYAAMYQNLTGDVVDRGFINAVSCIPQALDPPEKWKDRKSVPSKIREITFNQDQLEEAHGWVRGNLMIRDMCAEAGVWPRNELACDDYGGCEFLGLCSAPSEMARKARKMTQFIRKEER